MNGLPRQRPEDTRRKDLMDAPQSFYNEPRTETLTEVGDVMNRRGDFDPDPTDYAREVDVFEVLAALEALTVGGEVLA